MRFNDVPHALWVRDYLYESATDAIRKAVKDPSVPNKSRLQLKVNFPEGQPIPHAPVLAWHGHPCRPDVALTSLSPQPLRPRPPMQ